MSGLPKASAAGPERSLWDEYDSAALWCAKRGHTGAIGSPLPEGLSVRCWEAIRYDYHAFEERVRATAYALAMTGRDTA